LVVGVVCATVSITQLLVPAAHTPERQLSPDVQTFPSSQGAPSGFATGMQLPEKPSQVLCWWHWSGGGQTTGFVPVQVPDWQRSVCVQAFPSLHLVPSGAFGFEQAPVPGSQVPATWQASCAVQVTGLPTQLPAWQLSFCVQAFLSSQLVPSVLAGFEHAPVPGSQVPTLWH
jgi:hypothetical protein